MKLSRAADVPFQEIQGQVVIVVPAKREIHQLDEVAAFVWDRLAEPRTLEDLVGEICGEFEVDPGRAEADLRAFAECLEEKGLLVRS